MRRRQPLPRLWLMTDERQGEALWAALDRLPRGAGIVFRHYGLEERQRRALFERLRPEARRRGLVLVTAGRGLPRADGVHNRRGPGLRTASAHNLREIRRAERRGAEILFLSPVFATRSHPGAGLLGPRRFARLARLTRLPVVALGGMDAARFDALRGAYGWAGIDAFA
ncbi:MAG: thiamine phosphate synthase [Alphaproteobacteria bacterium]|nr:thiamine phosphate synthase [Alphaproteobacteria bacterium]